MIVRMGDYQTERRRREEMDQEVKDKIDHWREMKRIRERDDRITKTIMWAVVMALIVSIFWPWFGK